MKPSTKGKLRNAFAKAAAVTIGVGTVAGAAVLGGTAVVTGPVGMVGAGFIGWGAGTVGVKAARIVHDRIKYG